MAQHLMSNVEKTVKFNFEMGLWVQLSVTEIYLGLTNHPGQLSLAIPSWVGGMSTGDVFWPLPGKKRRVLCESRPCNQDCWHIGLAG